MGIFDKRKNYKPFEYPEVQPLIDSINQTYWTVNEVDFTGDIQDFKTRLTPKEQEILRRSLLAIAQVEVDVKTFWGDLYKHFPKPEFNNMGATFAENEIRHSEGYSKLLEVLNYEKDFEKILEIPVFKEKLQLIEDSMTSKTDILEKLLFFTIVIENTSLFSQFANVLSFNTMKGVMKNVSNIILWSRVDEECLLPDSQILTPKGFKKITDLKIGDIVYGYKDGIIKEEPVLGIIQKKNKDGYLYKIKNKKHSIITTPGHQQITYNNSRGWFKDSVEKLRLHHHYKLPVTGNFINNNSNYKREFTDLDRLKIAIQADGTLLKYFANGKNRKIPGTDNKKALKGAAGGCNYSIAIYKDRKIKRLKNILENLGIPYLSKEVINHHNNSGVVFTFHFEYGSNYKNFDWVYEKPLTREYCEQFVLELKYWDGFDYTNDSSYFGYCSSIKKNIDIVEHLGILAGYRCNIYKNNDSKRGENYNDGYKVHFSQKDKLLTCAGGYYKKKIEYNGEVVCVTVPSGGIIVKNDKNSFITGNCHANGGILLLNLINREYPEKIQSLKSGLLESIKKYIEYESKLLDWIFEEGELDWYTKEDMLNFMKFRVDEALSKMDFIDKKKDLLFNITPEQLSPMKWWDIETKSQSLTDFFSQRPVDYSKHNQPFSEDNLF